MRWNERIIDRGRLLKSCLECWPWKRRQAHKKTKKNREMEKSEYLSERCPRQHPPCVLTRCNVIVIIVSVSSYHSPFHFFWCIVMIRHILILGQMIATSTYHHNQHICAAPRDCSSPYRCVNGVGVVVGMWTPVAAVGWMAFAGTNISIAVATSPDVAAAALLLIALTATMSLAWLRCKSRH